MTASSLAPRILVLVTFGLSASETFLVACQKVAPSSTTDPVDAAREGAAELASDDGSAFIDDDVDASGRAALGVEARAEARRDGGAVDPACESASLSLLGAAADERCRVSDREWNSLVQAVALDAGKSTGLRQEARRDGERIVLSLVNAGLTPVVVPLRFHPSRPELAFSVLAEDDRRALFELAPPTPEPAPSAPPHDAGARPTRRSALLGLDGGTSFTRVHSARIRLAPGAVARARLTIDPRVLKRLDRSCGADAGAPDGGGDCLPSRLPKGHVVLYVGQLVAGIDVGAPARVEWEAP